MVDEKILVTRTDAAKLLSLSLRSLDYLIARRELPARRVGRRVLIPRRALEDFALRDHVRALRQRDRA
jgi:excisionase family DNA binding protein